MLELKLTGADDLNRAIAKLPDRLSKNAAFEALVISLQPMVKAVRENAPKRQGNLKVSIGVRLRRYRGGRVLYGVIGARLMDFPLGHGKKASPYRYIHLVERGHWSGKGKNKVFVKGPGFGFMRKAWMSQSRKTMNQFRKIFGDKLLIEIANRRKQTKYT